MLEKGVRSGLEVLTTPDLELDAGITAAFTCRRGGSSKGSFDSLNLSYNVGDDRRSVDRNREAVAEAIGVPVGRWVLPIQVHGTAVVRVAALDACRGGTDHSSGIPRTDALLTTARGIALAVLTADCVPLILVSAGAPAAAVVHAGWRGVLSGIPASAAGALGRCDEGGCREILAMIGPHIASCCMEVGANVEAAFENAFGAGIVHDHKVDLSAACRRQLLAAGLLPENIFDSGICTRCSEEYFSHRRDPKCGRQGAFLTIRR